MQQPPQMIPMMHAFPTPNITTEQIQKYLDENKKLILAILDNQNLGKLAECAQYQAQLQKNLMYLAAIADAQPQTPAMPPQMAQDPAMQQGGYYMQHPQATVMAQQPGFFPSKMPLQFGTPHQMQDSTGRMGMRPDHGIHPSPSQYMESTLIAQSSGQPDARSGNKRAASTDGAESGEGEEPR